VRKRRRETREAMEGRGEGLFKAVFQESQTAELKGGPPGGRPGSPSVGKHLSTTTTKIERKGGEVVQTMGKKGRNAPSEPKRGKLLEDLSLQNKDFNHSQSKAPEHRYRGSEKNPVSHTISFYEIKKGGGSASSNTVIRDGRA